MMLHEMTTNAIKYGALSVPEGKVQVAWDLQPGSRDRTFLHCEWSETNGPSISQPTRLGFGTQLIQGTCTQANGVVDLSYPPEGFRAQFKIPL
jgi:two-component sensor histidine kinase